MITRLRLALHRWRVRRSFARRAWPLFVVLILAGCAHFREQRDDIHAIERECIERAPTIPTEQLSAFEADCEARIREVERRR